MEKPKLNLLSKELVLKLSLTSINAKKQTCREFLKFLVSFGYDFLNKNDSYKGLIKNITFQ
jgi:hypothetical protein